jgi:Holliday junction DNA helicase RuvB
MTDFRPQGWNEYIGQEKVRARLDISIQAANNRGDRMEHVFLYGPPGSGKTSLAQVVADRLDINFESVVMPLSDQALRQIVMQNHGVILLDELHRSSKKQQESLLTLVEDGVLMNSSGSGIENPELCIIGATTERGKIIKPLFDRFALKPEFDPYTDDEMAAIAFGMLRRVKLDTQYDMEFAKALGLAAGGVPRNVKSMVVAVRDLIDSGVKDQPTITDVLDATDVTYDGLSRLHVSYLKIMGKNGGNSLGLKPLALQLQASEDMVLEIESLLFQRGYIRYTKAGRDLTQTGWKRSKALIG